MCNQKLELFLLTLPCYLTSFVCGMGAGLSGLAVTYGLNLNVNRIMWNLCKLQTKIIAVERIQQYTCIPSEAPLVIEKKRPSPTWPSHGTVELENLQVCLYCCMCTPKLKLRHQNY
jgi:ABC-type multidrug transport system fused ATPase/permease subunit